MDGELINLEIFVFVRGENISFSEISYPVRMPHFRFVIVDFINHFN